MCVCVFTYVYACHFIVNCLLLVTAKVFFSITIKFDILFYNLKYV